MVEKIPAISVIIPLYNAEKYIGECLDSLLAQTFKNFEVVVVDDCSTDNSSAIVKRYEPKFKGRLKLTKTRKNSGGPGIPRNLGIEISRGDYLSIIDNDDALTPTALEELYNLAKKFDADIVHCEKFYSVPEKEWHDKNFRKKIKPASLEYSPLEYVTEPTFLNENIAERFNKFQKIQLVWNLWTKLVRRNILIENEISFMNYPYEDMLVTFCLLCCAKRYLLVPNAVNYYRVRENSLSHETPNQKENFQRFIRTLTFGYKKLEKFFDDQEIFSRYPDFRFAALNFLMDRVFVNLDIIKPPISWSDFDKILREEFRGSDSALTAFIFGVAWQNRSLSKKNQARVIQLEKFAIQAQKRIAELENELNRIK